ncbi:hypothetical protein L218DRAFT_1080798 [Marasmius fiardii PR-910]|nr:hypothetical protein L218DRAFT_1080798 [Marasmius fiardii PR-910]
MKTALMEDGRQELSAQDGRGDHRTPTSTGHPTSRKSPFFFTITVTLIESKNLFHIFGVFGWLPYSEKMDSATTRQCHCRFDVEESRTRLPGPSESLIEEYRTRNGYPLPDEAASIEAAMEQTKRQESLLSETIASLQSVIVALMEEKSRIQGEIGKYRAILRPMHRMPPELLGKIFSFAADLSAAEDPFQTPSHFIQPGCPGFWHRANQSFLRAQAYRVNLQLNRSGHQLIDVFVSTCNLKEDMDPLLLLLCSHSSRWKTLHIELNDKDVSTLSLIRNHLPLLELLHVHCAKRPLNELDYFELAPRLRTLAVSGAALQEDGGFPLKLSKNQVNHFRYSQPTSIAIPRLEIRERPRDVPYSVPLPFLMELELNHTEKKSGIETTLSLFKIQCLRIFTIFSTGPIRTPFVDFFTEPSLSPPLLTPSPTALRSLTIHRVEMPADEFSAVLDLLTGLETLKFGVQKGITNDYLELIHDTTSTASFSIIPNLQTLALLPTEGVESQYDDEVLANLLELRWRRLSEPGSPQPDNRLLFVEVDRRILDETVRGRLDQLRGEGMRIKEMEELRFRTGPNSNSRAFRVELVGGLRCAHANYACKNGATVCYSDLDLDDHQFGYYYSECGGLPMGSKQLTAGS